MKNQMKVGMGLALMAGVTGFVLQTRTQHTQKKPSIQRALKALERIAFTPAHATEAMGANDIDRLVLIKTLYYYINGGPDGTWPSGETSSLTGGDAPEGMENGSLGVLNDMVGEGGDLTTLLSANGYTTCSTIPTSGSLTAEDPDLGTLNVEFKVPTRTVPIGFENEGLVYDRQISFKVDGATDPFMVVLGICSKPTQTVLVRYDGITNDVATRYEFHMESTTTGGILLQVFSDPDTGGKTALRFKTTDGDNFEIMVAYGSGASDGFGNGPARVLAATAGIASANKVSVWAMGGNATGDGVTVSNDLSSLPYDSTQTPENFAAGNQFCYDVAEQTTAEGCELIVAVEGPASQMLAAWTMDSIYDMAYADDPVRIEAISEF